MKLYDLMLWTLNHTARFPRHHRHSLGLRIEGTLLDLLNLLIEGLCPMAEYGEWNRKGATLSDVTAQKEYGVSRDFIAKGIRAGKLEFREGVLWGNPYLKVLRSQLEQYIAEKLGANYLSSGKNQAELRKIKKEMGALKKRLNELQSRKTEIERATRT